MLDPDTVNSIFQELILAYDAVKIGHFYHVMVQSEHLQALHNC